MDERQVTQLWEDYENGLKYQSAMGLGSKLPQFVRFYEGDQWPPPTKNTKNLPRPVINLIKMICRSKKSAILSTPVKLVYTAEDENADTERFNRFAEYIGKELGQEGLDKQAIHDGVIKGSYFYHYYWDAEARGKDGVREGALRGEIIDPLNIFFANPKERDEQKQKWILIRSREEVSSVRESMDEGLDAESVCADESEERYGAVEQEGDKLCTVLTKYFRRDGEVFCEKATRYAVVNRPFPIAPDIEAAWRELDGEDAPNNSLPDTPKKPSVRTETLKAPLYPIVAGSYEPRNNSIYGLGEVEGLIPNQKSVNFLFAMSLLNAQETAWGKYIVHPQALGEQVITNEPGQVLVDHSKTGSGIRKMTEQTMQSFPIQLADTLTQMTRSVTGAGEIMTGETVGGNLSGAAIAQLQAQARIPTEELKEAFWLVKEKQGKVLAQFFKLFYQNKRFSYTVEAPIEPQEAGDVPPSPGTDPGAVRQSDVFHGAEYLGTEFDVVVETTGGTKSGAAGDITVLDALFAKGAITLKTYLNAYPKDALSNKTELMRGIEAQEQEALRQLTAQNEQLTEQNRQYVALIEKQNESVEDVNRIIRENMELKELLARLRAEAEDKIRAGNTALMQTTADAREFAQTLVARQQ